MKSFFKTIFATFFALVLFAISVVVVLIAMTIALARMGSSQEPKIDKGSYLVVDMSMNIADTPPRLPARAGVAAGFRRKGRGHGFTAAVA